MHEPPETAGMNFDGDDVIDVDRSKATWPQTEAELDKLWMPKSNMTG